VRFSSDRARTSREDGKVFCGYRKGANGPLEHWTSKDSFEKRRLRINALNKARIERLRSDPTERAEMNKRWAKYMHDSRRARPTIHMLARVKRRAKERGLAFDLVHADIHIPDTCPVLGIALSVSTGGASDNSPELDRIDNTKGYVKGNVLVVSRRANRIKNDATVQELEKIAAFYRALTQPTQSQERDS